MDKNTSLEIKDGDTTQPLLIEAPPIREVEKPTDGIVKKKRRRGKTKRKIMKPFLKVPWQDRRKYDKPKRNNRFRKIVVAKTRAPFNNNQFLMEIHKPEPENNFHLAQTPSARTRDSSFSIDSEDNYFFSLPEDEEEYLTKEFSSVYEDAQTERLSNMSKNELIQEYLILEAKYDSLVKRTDRSKPKLSDEEKDGNDTDKDNMSTTDKDSMVTDRDTSGTSNQSSTLYPVEPTIADMLQRLKEQEDQIRELKLANEKLHQENEHLQQASQGSTSEDSESDSSSSSDSCSSSSRSNSPANNLQSAESNDIILNENEIMNLNGENGIIDASETECPLVNGFHSPNEK
ncbi:unnamed protein product [Diatraea saccharalis]|uniref:Protein HEXIM1 n=1 Tax=Diatraea saccharalis TaxID=40085 RepID=A0A9N9R456_9NEOP|nr:unnamed protein product [Diatraea saccharalis]